MRSKHFLRASQTYMVSLLSLHELPKLALIPFLHASEDLLTPLLRQLPSCLQAQPRLTTASGVLRNTRGISSQTSTLPQRMPAHAWDCHMHVTSPDYALAADAAYTPSLHNLQHAMSFEKKIGINNIVLVQPSIYGNDNSCLLDALKSIGPHHGRGVVGIDPATIEQTTLQEWHRLGVRGVRLNLKSNNAQFTEKSLRDTLKLYAKAMKPLNWVLELFIGMEHIPILERAAGGLGVQLCIAHFGAPKLPPMGKRTAPLNPYDLAGFQALVNLLQAGNTWVKFSAAYRFDEYPEIRGIEAVARELLKIAANRVVFASDWPHTRFEGLDVSPFVEKCLQWTEAAGVTDDVFCLNAKRLWDVEE
jgi:predicted TIM-barrel fold metal-dependent hydrolase